MSFITSGVKILDEPRRYFLLSAGARDSAASPVAVRLAMPLPLVLASARAGFALAFTGADFALAFLAAFLAISGPHLLFRHPGESRDPLNSHHASSASRFAL